MIRTFLGVVLATVLIGCNNTMEGIKEDSAKNGEVIKSVSKDAEAKSDVVAGNIEAAAALTPRLKGALIKDDQLKADGNLIDVDSTEQSVTLSGHVKSQALKVRAGDIVTKELQDAKAKQSLINNLEVKP